MNDNRDENEWPFKGPFKGKGANRRALQLLLAKMNMVREEMEQVENQFKKIFPNRRTPVHLRILKREYPLLWWRRSGSSGSYVRLFTTPEGQELLNDFMPETLNRLKEFDQVRLRLNFQATVVGNTIMSYKRYIEGTDKLNQTSS